MGTTVNYANPKIDGTVRIFDEFYVYSANVPQLEYDAVYSYFLSVFGTPEAAGNFTVTVFRISESSVNSCHDLVARIPTTNSTRTDLDLGLLSQQRAKQLHPVGNQCSHTTQLLCSQECETMTCPTSGRDSIR
jgi:hypothetical protein